MANIPAAPLRTFVMYAHEDKPVRDKLLRQLRPLADNGDLDLWSDHEIKPGELWDEAIRQRLAQSELILLLISDDFFASDYIRNVELREALARHERGETRLLPIIARHCGWEDVPALARLQVLPPEGRPIVSKEWDSPDEPYRRVYEGVKIAVGELRKVEAAPPPVPLAASPPARTMPAPAHESVRRAFAWRLPALLAGTGLLAFLLWRSCAGFPARPAEVVKDGPNISTIEKTADTAGRPPEKQTPAEPKPSDKNPPAGSDGQTSSQPITQKIASPPAEQVKKTVEPAPAPPKPAPEYDRQLPAVSGMAILIKGRKKSFLNVATGTPLSEWYDDVENFNAEGRAYVKRNNHYFWIDKTGRCVEKCQ